MAEMMSNNPKSEFYDKSVWNEGKKERVLRATSSIVLKHISRGFCLRVVKDDYDEVVPLDKRDIMGNYHYTYAVRAVIGFIENWRKSVKIDEPIEYIFDRMTKGDSKTEIERVFAEAELITDSLHKYGIYKGCHSFRDKAHILPLQAADLFAWLSQRSWAYEYEGKPMPDYAIEVWNKILLSGLVDAKSQTKEQLMDLVSKNPKALVTLPPDWKLHKT